SLAKVKGAVVGVNVRSQSLADDVVRQTDGWGADVVFECSGNERAAAEIFDIVCPGGCAVMIGIPLVPFAHDVSRGCVKEVRIEHVFRYAHVFPRCIAMLASGAVDVAPLITETYAFDESIEAFEFAAEPTPGSVKVQIEMPA
ncbi:MAG: zinc-binding dehydrogenase, partial [Pseudomonadota bacterium]